MADTKQIAEIFDHKGNQVKEGSILMNKQAKNARYVCVAIWGIMTKGKTTNQKWSCVSWLRFVRLPFLFQELKKTEEGLKKSLLPEYFEPKSGTIPLREGWLSTPTIERGINEGRSFSEDFKIIEDHFSVDNWKEFPHINCRKTGGRLDEVMDFLPQETTMNQSCFKNCCLWQTAGDTIDMKAIREAVIENGDENFERYKSPHNILKKRSKNANFSKLKLKVTKYWEGHDGQGG